MRPDQHTDEEVAFLLAHFGSRGSRFCADALDRSLGSVRQKAFRLGLRMGAEQRIKRSLNAAETMRSRRAWTPEEDAVLIANLKTCGSAACARMLSGRSRSMCIARGKKLGIYITEEDTNAVRALSWSHATYEYEPTKEEIAKVAAEIRAEWQPSDRRIAAEQREYTPTVYRVRNKRR